MAGDQHDDKTAIASPEGKRKFLDADTHLKTAIYDEAGPESSVVTKDGKPPPQPVPEAVSRVFAKAEELLADLGAKNAQPSGDDPTIPTEEDGPLPQQSDDVTRLQRPRGAQPPPDSARAPTNLEDETSIALKRAPLADGSADVLINADPSVDTPVISPPIVGASSRGSNIGSSIDIGMEEADSTVLERRNPLKQNGGDVTTQIEAVPLDLDGAPVHPTMPGHGAPLSDQPIAPGPMAAPTMPQAQQSPRQQPGPQAPPQGPPPQQGPPQAQQPPEHPTFPQQSQQPPGPSQPQLGPQGPQGEKLPFDAPIGGDGMQTLHTDLAPQGMPVPTHIQPRPMAAVPARRTGFGGFVDSIKRLFGWRPPPTPPAYPPEDDDDFSGYGAGTYTVANRHVANRHRRDSGGPKNQ